MAVARKQDLPTRGGSSRSRRPVVGRSIHFTGYVAHVFLQGMIIVIPVAVAAYVILWVIRSGEGFARGLFLDRLPSSFYFPGLGLLLLIAGILALGWLASQARPRLALRAAERIMRRTPLFGMVYSPVRDLMNLFGDGVQDRLGQVVMIEIPNTNMETLGFITRDDMSDLPDGLDRSDHVVVYVQWSSQIGGYCFIVPRDSVRPVDISVEEGMRWALTAGISAPTKGRSSEAPRKPDTRGGRPGSPHVHSPERQSRSESSV